MGFAHTYFIRNSGDHFERYLEAFRAHIKRPEAINTDKAQEAFVAKVDAKALAAFNDEEWERIDAKYRAEDVEDAA